MVDDKDKKKPDIDQETGIETTGHEWDGIKELNLPAPRWWLIVFIITIIWSVGYWIVYPAWPTLSGNTKGIFGWTQYKKLQDEQSEIIMRKSEFLNQITTKSLSEINADKELYNFALRGGNAAFKENCAACHGSGAEGRKGFPNLNDDDWLWGGSLDAIYTVIKYGVRSGHENTRLSEMPAFGRDGILKADDISHIADFVLSGLKTGDIKSEPLGAKLYQQNCASCHGASGKGGREFGAPNLVDSIWFYGGAKQDVIKQVNYPKHGVMPNWDGRMSEATIKQLAVYVHSLGGGE